MARNCGDSKLFLESDCCAPEALSKSVPVMGAAVGEFGSKTGQQKSDTEPAPLPALSPRDIIQMSKENDDIIQHILFKEEATAKLYLEKNIHKFFEGMLIAAWAVEAKKIYIYINELIKIVLLIRCNCLDL